MARDLAARHWDRLAVSGVLVGGVLRIVWILFAHPPVDYVYSDMRGYVVRAEHLAWVGSLGPNDAFYPPGTHVLLAVPLKLYGDETGLWAAAVLWCALSIAAVWLSWRLARELLSPAAGAITAILCALSPLFITSGGYFTSETPALAFMLAALWLGAAATRRTGRVTVVLALVSGSLGGVAVAIRPQLLLNMAIVAALIIWVFRRRIAPLAGFATGLAVVLALVVVHNSVATNQLTGLANNGGLNFWFGHCDARKVVALDHDGRTTAHFTHAVPNLAGRGDDYVYRDVEIWDDDFFYNLGWKCIEDDGAGHVIRLGRNVIDMTATTVPFPQAEDGRWVRDVARASNLLYSVLLPVIVIASLIDAVRRRRRGEAIVSTAFLLANLACVVVVAVLILGDPRVRSVYDVFGLALLAALLADRFHLDEAEP